jgi:hypothetical protein
MMKNSFLSIWKTGDGIEIVGEVTTTTVRNGMSFSSLVYTLLNEYEVFNLGGSIYPPKVPQNFSVSNFYTCLNDCCLKYLNDCMHVSMCSVIICINLLIFLFDFKNKSWLGSLISTIIGNLKLSISNIHIRYEDGER